MLHNALDFLQEAIDAIGNRAAERDQPSGERTIPTTVRMFNELTKHTLTPREGWIFMAILKMVRAQYGKLKLDDYLDGSAYFALAGEEAVVEAELAGKGNGNGQG